MRLSCAVRMDWLGLVWLGWYSWWVYTQELVSLVREVGYDQAFTYSYSLRAQTYAGLHLRDDVAPHIKARRLGEVIDAFQLSAAVRNNLLEVRALLKCCPCWLSRVLETFFDCYYPPVFGFPATEVLSMNGHISTEKHKYYIS